MNPISKKQKVEELGQPHSEAGDCGANEGKEGLIDTTTHILPFHTVHGVLKARTLKWFAISQFQNWEISTSRLYTVTLLI